MNKRSEIQISDVACGEFRAVAEFAGRKWNAAILMALQLGARRYSDLLEQIEGVSGRLLTARLHDLALAGLVVRHVVPTTPVQITYSLTESGRELIAVLHPLVSWSRRWNPAGAAATAPAPADTRESATVI